MTSLTRWTLPLRHPWWSLAAALTAALAAGCGSGDGQGVDVPALVIRTTTTGTGLDPDAYRVTGGGGTPWIDRVSFSPIGPWPLSSGPTW